MSPSSPAMSPSSPAMSLSSSPLSSGTQTSSATASQGAMPSLDLAQRSLAPPPTPFALTSYPVATGSGTECGDIGLSSPNPDGRVLHDGTGREDSELTHALAIATATKKKGKNFGPDEDLNLAAAWLDVSQDPIVGDEQTREVFWKSVHAEFLKRMKRAGRDPNQEQRVATSLQTRWRTLQATCNKFAGCYAAVFARNESGKSMDDKVLDAHVLYRAQNKSAFKSQAVWAILRNSPKWFESLADKKVPRKRRSTTSGCDASEDAAPTEQSDTQRPVGRKSAKKTLEIESNLAALVAKMARETETKNRLLKEATDEQIMARCLDGMSATQRRFYELKQEQILKELQNELGAQ